MMRINNPEWAMKELSNFVEATKIVPHPSPNVFMSVNAGSIDKILDGAIFSDWKQEFPYPCAKKWLGYHEVASRAKTAFERQAEIEEKLGDNSPCNAALQPHPWIWDGARSLWNSSHFREAVSAALRKLNAETQSKIGRREISETDLFKHAFPLDPAQEGKSACAEWSPTYQSMQRGTMAFA
ncbi:TIGR02391 family protein [Rothia dentocariosa]|jgi:putative uncharacterized protein hsdX|uniref:TIGR02391 family protein n=1 Tax=Rothia dentocariosa TaxID=2047 RepID=UPI0039A058FF